jgi:adenylate kinase
MMIPVIIFLGAPGAGKGTQAVFLSRTKGIPKISTGDMLRRAVEQESELGKRVKSIMAEGKLVDDEIMLSLIKERIVMQDCSQGFILDGYPRNIHQAAQLEQVLLPGMQMRVIDIHVAEDDIVKRVAGRRVCPKCQTNYNVYFHPSKKEGVCDHDGADLFRRQDDDEEVVRMRISTYKKESYPLVEHYRRKGVLQIVNGVQKEEEVTNAILQQVACQ